MIRTSLRVISSLQISEFPTGDGGKRQAVSVKTGGPFRAKAAPIPKAFGRRLQRTAAAGRCYLALVAEGKNFSSILLYFGNCGGLVWIMRVMRINILSLLFD
jgi:hypothetical protein